MATTVETLILRFRDLITEPGGTIELHNKVSAVSPNHVWWGWWNKSGETVPAEVFQSLVQRCKSGPVPILLLDSGRELMFTALCHDVRWDTSYEPMPSPDLTPEYYRIKKCRAWFRLGPITGIDAAELQKYTYVDVDSFFENRLSRYKRFEGKQVHDTDELRQQDRSIWFVRPFASGDPVFKISLLDPRSLTPSNYPLSYETSKSRTLLWFSDTHFTTKNHHHFPLASTGARSALYEAVRTVLEKNSVLDVAGIILSGDITWEADPAEFKLARKFLSEIASYPSKLDNYRIALCPGNHDVKFTATPADLTARITDVVAPDSSRSAFSDFYQELFYLRPNEFLSSSRRLLLGEGCPVEIVCLNSSLLEQKKDWFQGMGFVGQDQLEHVEKNLGWKTSTVGADVDRPRPFRIVVMHHHLMPVTYAETPVGGYSYSVALDAERVVQWLVRHRVDLVLHGHMHKEFCAKVSRPTDGNPANLVWHDFWVLGMGSTGVAKDHRDGKNMFGVLRFGNTNVSIDVHTIAETGESENVWTMEVPIRR